MLWRVVTCFSFSSNGLFRSNNIYRAENTLVCFSVPLSKFLHNKITLVLQKFGFSMNTQQTQSKSVTKSHCEFRKWDFTRHTHLVAEQIMLHWGHSCLKDCLYLPSSGLQLMKRWELKEIPVITLDVGQKQQWVGQSRRKKKPVSNISLVFFSFCRNTDFFFSDWKLILNSMSRRPLKRLGVLVSSGSAEDWISCLRSCFTVVAHQFACCRCDSHLHQQRWRKRNAFPLSNSYLCGTREDVQAFTF